MSRFGDTKEGAFAIRLVEPFTERKGGHIVDADGRVSMKNVWGKRSNWVDYTATVDSEPLGVAIFDHPSNPRHPTYWHARDYGLFALNPFGRNAFDPKLEESQWKLPKGEKTLLPVAGSDPPRRRIGRGPVPGVRGAMRE